MKQQLKQIIKDVINSSQYDREYIITQIIYCDDRCDKEDSSETSQYHFEQLNVFKNRLRAVNITLKKLQQIQRNIKNISYISLSNGKILVN